MKDPIWWTNFDYKFALASTVITGLAIVGGGIWRLSRRYTLILAELGTKVSHTEMDACKQEITEYVGKANRKLKDELKADIKADHDDNKADHRQISEQITNQTNLIVSLAGNKNNGKEG